MYSSSFCFEVGGEGGAIIQEVRGDLFCFGGEEVGVRMSFGDVGLGLGGQVVQSEQRLMCEGLRGLVGRVVSSVPSLSLDF